MLSTALPTLGSSGEQHMVHSKLCMQFLTLSKVLMQGKPFDKEVVDMQVRATSMSFGSRCWL